MFETSLSPQACDALDQTIQQQIQRHIDELLKTGRWAAYHHPLLDDLCQLMASHLGVTHVRLCPSGSAAIELALRACNLEPGSEVICSALDYPGNIRAVRLLDLQPVIVDIAPQRFTLGRDAVEAASSPKTRAVLVSHLYGDIAPVDELRRLCDAHDWCLIEDVCQMPGASIGYQKLGSCGHVAAFSFGGNKPITCGAGGGIVTSDRRMAARIDQYVDRPSDSLTISPLQAAVLLPQWQHLGELTERHRLRLASWLLANDTAERSWMKPDQLSQGELLPVVYKLPVQRTDVTTADSDGTAEWSQSLGELFRPQIKALPGRGRVCGAENAIKAHQNYGLLDTRKLLHPTIFTDANEIARNPEVIG